MSYGKLRSTTSQPIHDFSFLGYIRQTRFRKRLNKYATCSSCRFPLPVAAFCSLLFPVRQPPSNMAIGNLYVISAIAVIGGGLFGFDISSMSVRGLPFVIS
jgi:hypothetical protein